MAESTYAQLKNSIADSPATDRLKYELKNYLAARAQHTVSHLGHRLGEGVTALGEGGQGAGMLNSLAKGGQALAEGKSPAQAALSAGTEHVKGMVKDKIKGVFGGGKSGGGKSKSVLISEDIDVGVPIREAYNQWTQFQEFSAFAKGVVSVDKTDDTSSNWTLKVAKSTRSWKADVTEQVADERISWTTEGAKGTVKGLVTFHSLTEDLTRVLLVIEYFPKGLFEKTGNIWRAQGRRARLDLKLYRKFIMMRGEASDGWRGEIRDGQVVVEHDQAVEEENRAEESSADESHDGEDFEGSEGEYEDGDDEEEGEGEEYDAEEDLLHEDEGEDEDEDEEVPPRRRQFSARR
ncbi:SRPBCC family protein [Streptomyces sp. NPDC049970]|uniref:SRPBCC family protein n=1 Tax=Streptomyces sp. NPDC049970 TaxID=3155033 RepID=UPI00341403BF